MNIYLAGPMRGIPDFNFPLFNRAAAYLRSLGHVVFNPAEHDLACGYDPALFQCPKGDHTALEAAGFDIRKALGADLAWICSTADAVALLPGWRRSKGARAEQATAVALGLPTYEVEVDKLGAAARGGRVMSDCGIEDDIQTYCDTARLRAQAEAESNAAGTYIGLGRHFDVVVPQPAPIPVPERSDEDPLSDADMVSEMRRGLGLEPVGPRMVLPADSAERKRLPIFNGVLRYFPRALAAVAKLSLAANDKHNPGEPLHWSRNRSSDHLDALTRHLIDSGAVDPEFGLLHDVGLAWRALANLELKLEAQEQE